MTIILLVGSAFLLMGLFVLLWNEKKRMLADLACNWPQAYPQGAQVKIHYDANDHPGERARTRASIGLFS
jgi:hypothetical protein